MTQKQKAEQYTKLINNIKWHYEYHLERIDEDITRYKERYNFNRYKCHEWNNYCEGHIHAFGKLLGYKHEKIVKDIEAIYNKHFEELSA